MKSSCHSLIHFLPLFCSCQVWRLDTISFFCSQAYILAGWRPETRLFTFDYCSAHFYQSQSQSQSYVTTNGQSASLSWNKAPIWSLWRDFYYCQTVVGFLMWSALSDERTSLPFTVIAGPHQRSYSLLPNTSYSHFAKTTQKIQHVLLTRPVCGAVA
jgi:hypothetical protein